MLSTVDYSAKYCSLSVPTWLEGLENTKYRNGKKKSPCCDMFYCDRDLKKVFFNPPRTGRKIDCKYTELH